ncbi:MAG: TetR/AcrR family transcriptional regulator [Ignavibacteriae bacterium]|nr:TetR/AcrR family transcriptional regulator [Ignavibacteriota bacterium]
METVVNTKSQILEVSLKLFSEKSYHGASIREIAKAVNIRESAIYNHFKSKEEILSEIVKNFSNRNFGSIILTDSLINQISKPQKFFLLLSQNIINFWDSANERMFIKILLNLNSVNSEANFYTIDNYLSDFRKLCSFIFKEMINHKFLKNIDLELLSNQFLSPLFLIELKKINSANQYYNFKTELELHSEFIWEAVKK